MNTKLTQLLAAAAIAMTAASCTQETVPGPELTFDSTTINIPYEAGEHTISYYLVNQDGDKLPTAVTDSPEWITGIDMSVLGQMTLTVSENTAEASREGSLTVSYPGIDDISLKVIQGSYTVPFTIVIDETDEISVTASVYPADKEATYIMMLTTKERYDELGSDEANFQDDMDYYTEMALQEGMSLEDFLSQYILETGDLEKVKTDMLQPESDYVVYAYGLTAQAERTTAIVSEYTSTKAVEMTGCTFDITPEVNFNNASVTVVPSDQTVGYHTSVQSASYIEESGMALDEFLANYIENEIIFSMYVYGYSHDQAVAALTKTGTQTIDYALEAEKDYVAFAFSLTKTGLVSSEISSVEFKTEGAEQSDNELDIKVVHEGIVSVDLDVTATNDDSYGMKAIKASEIEGMSNSEIAGYIMEVLNFSMYTGTSRVVLQNLEAGTEYYAVGFGFDLDAYAITTDIFKTAFTTGTSSGATSVSFDISEDNIKARSADITINADPEDVLYLWGVADGNLTGQMIVDEINDECNSYVEYEIFASRAEYMRAYSRSGSFTQTVGDLMEDTKYQVYAIGVDYETGEFISEIALHPFTTAKPTLADLSVKVEYDKYFKGDELAEMYPDEFAGAQGYTILPVFVKFSGSAEPAYYKYHIYNGNVMDTERYSDGYIKDFLDDYGKSQPRTDYATFTEREYTLIAYALDKDGNSSPVFRELLYLSADGYSPAEEYEGYSGLAQSAADFRENTPGIVWKYRNGSAAAPAHDQAKTTVTEMPERSGVRTGNCLMKEIVRYKGR